MRTLGRFSQLPHVFRWGYISRERVIYFLNIAPNEAFLSHGSKSKVLVHFAHCFRRLSPREIFGHGSTELHSVHCRFLPEQQPKHFVCELPERDQHAADWLDLSTRMQTYVDQFISKFKTFSQIFREKCMSEVVRLGSIIIFIWVSYEEPSSPYCGKCKLAPVMQSRDTLSKQVLISLLDVISNLGPISHMNTRPGRPLIWTGPKYRSSSIQSSRTRTSRCSASVPRARTTTLTMWIAFLDVHFFPAFLRQPPVWWRILRNVLTHILHCIVATCSSPWRAHGDRCYQLMDQAKGKWTDARDTCLGLGAELPVINSQEENDFILGVASTASQVPLRRLWLGLRRTVLSHTFSVWVDGTHISDFRNWASGEPNDLGGEGCAEMMVNGESRGKWNDIGCTPSDMHAVMCEKAL